jgi:hypothetical protein
VGKQWRERMASLPALPVLSAMFDDQMDMTRYCAERVAEWNAMVAERPTVADPPDDGQPRR